MSSFSINRVVLIGRLTRDPELRSLPTGTSVCQLRVACSSKKKEPSGEYHERPNFFDVSAFAGAADSAGRYLRKGSRVAVDGRLEWREWETSDHQRRQAVKIVADTILFLDGSGQRRVERTEDADAGEMGRASDGHSFEAEQEDNGDDLSVFAMGSPDTDTDMDTGTNVDTGIDTGMELVF